MSQLASLKEPWARRLVALGILMIAASMSRAALAGDSDGDDADEDGRVGDRRHINIDDYRQLQGFSLPSTGGPTDVLPDGRILVLSRTTLFRETAPRSRDFEILGELPEADLPSFGASFMRVSPDGSRIAVGNNGGASFSHFQVGVFALPSLTGTWYEANSDLATWIDDRYVALAAGVLGFPSVVTVFDTLSSDPAHPSNRTIIQNIGGASGGIAFDKSKNLYMGNAFSTTGPSRTGAVKAFRHSQWLSALRSGLPLDFESEGVLVITALASVPLNFDRSGNLVIGGADFLSGADTNFAVLASAAAVNAALRGSGPIDTNDPRQVRMLDPDPRPRSAYSIVVNRVLDEMYLRPPGTTEFVFSTSH